ncbi:MAG: SDR family oxidoreductase [Chitinophagaceae bacterium]|nr:MAG: SDR family oxidoreductase [Chitinophagaceae bacterium]
MEAHDAVSQLKGEGADVRGMTVWSMLGAYDWNTLLTQNNNFYEPGAFDVRSGSPRPTAIAHLIKTLCEGKAPDHPVLDAAGWWKNPEHVHFVFGMRKDARGLPTIEMMFPENLLSSSSRPILITGATGTLGRAFAHICNMRNISYALLSRENFDITNKAAVELVIEKHRPWAVINAAGFVNVDAAEVSSERCFQENAYGPVILAEVCKKYNSRFLTFSTDLVFDGRATSPYVESNAAAPLNIYGASKFYAENNVLKINPEALVIRTSAFFGPWDEHNFLARMIGNIKYGQFFYAANDQTVSPTYIPDLVNNCLDLLIDNEAGTWHLANQSAITWADFACKAAYVGGFNSDLIVPVPTSDLKLAAKRPIYSALSSERGLLMPHLDDAISRYFLEGIVS